MPLYGYTEQPDGTRQCNLCKQTIRYLGVGPEHHRNLEDCARAAVRKQAGQVCTHCEVLQNPEATGDGSIIHRNATWANGHVEPCLATNILAEWPDAFAQLV